MILTSASNLWNIGETFTYIKNKLIKWESLCRCIFVVGHSKLHDGL